VLPPSTADAVAGATCADRGAPARQPGAGVTNYYAAMAEAIRTRIRDALPDAAVPLARRAYYEARSNVILTEIARRRLLQSHRHDDRALLARVSPWVSPRENMGEKGWMHYFATGLDAIRCIDAVLARHPVEPRRILDLPSGWGRVLRFLRVRFPAATLIACDIVYDGPLYCARRFGAQAVLSAGDFDTLVLPGPFDLIWVGSLFSHLDAEHAESLLRLFARTLSADGVLVATTLGTSAIGRFQEAGGPGDQHEPDALTAAVAEYHDVGLGFVDYRRSLWPDAGEAEAMATSRYGVAFVSQSWMTAAGERAGLQSIHFQAQDWDSNQDVHGFRVART
jgi:Methyltransferase domain